MLGKIWNVNICLGLLKRKWVVVRSWLHYQQSVIITETIFHFRSMSVHTVYPKKYAHGFCFAVLCCGYTLTDFPIPIRLTSMALWQSNDCPSASKATLMNMDKYFMWIHYERLHNHNKAKHNKTVCIFLGIYCRSCIPGVYSIKNVGCTTPRGQTFWCKPTFVHMGHGFGSPGTRRSLVHIKCTFVIINV